MRCFFDTGTGRERIDSFRKPLPECSPDQLGKAELDLEMWQLDGFTNRLQIVIKKLAEIGQRDRRIQRFMRSGGGGSMVAR